MNEIEVFISNPNIAVIGASTHKNKFGYIIFHHLLKSNYTVFPVNPNAKEIDGMKCYEDISELPADVKSVVFVTKPNITEAIVSQICTNKNIENVWFQQGSESQQAIEWAKNSGKRVVYNECIMMYTKSGFPHNIHRFINKAIGKFPKE